MPESYYKEDLYDTSFYKAFIQSEYNREGGKADFARKLGISPQSLTRKFKIGFGSFYLLPSEFAKALHCKAKDIIDEKK